MPNINIDLIIIIWIIADFIGEIIQAPRLDQVERKIRAFSSTTRFIIFFCIFSIYIGLYIGYIKWTYLYFNLIANNSILIISIFFDNNIPPLLYDPIIDPIMYVIVFLYSIDRLQFSTTLIFFWGAVAIMHSLQLPPTSLLLPRLSRLLHSLLVQLY